MSVRLFGYRLLAAALLAFGTVPFSANSAPVITSTSPTALEVGPDPMPLTIIGDFREWNDDTTMHFVKPGPEDRSYVLALLALTEFQFHTILFPTLLDTPGYATLFIRSGDFVSHPFTIAVSPRYSPPDPIDVPEPVSLGLALLGLGAIGLARRRARSAS